MEALPRVLIHLNGKDAELRLKALEAIGEIGETAASEAVQK